MPLPQDKHPRGHLNPFGKPRKVAEQYKRLVEHVGMSVGPVPTFPLARVGAQDMVEDQQVPVAQGLGGLSKVADSRRVRPDLGLREDCS